MATSKSVLTFTVLSLAAAAFAGAALWLPRRRSGCAISPTADPSPSDEAAPAAEPASMTIVPFRAAAAPLSAVAGPISILGTATRQFLNLAAEPACTDMMVGPILRADLQLAAPPTFVTSCQYFVYKLCERGSDLLVAEHLLLRVHIFRFSHRSDRVHVRHPRDFLLYYRRHRVSIEYHPWLSPDYFDVSCSWHEWCIAISTGGWSFLRRLKHRRILLCRSFFRRLRHL